MVDADVEIAGVVAKGKLLTLTTSEALEHKVAELTADTLDAALEAAGLPDAEVRHATQTWAETLVRFLTNPVVSSLLMTRGHAGPAGGDPDAGVRGARARSACCRSGCSSGATGSSSSPAGRSCCWCRSGSLLIALEAVRDSRDQRRRASAGSSRSWPASG